jgi:hypothetical protein
LAVGTVTQFVPSHCTTNAAPIAESPTAVQLFAVGHDTPRRRVWVLVRFEDAVIVQAVPFHCSANGFIAMDFDPMPRE